jgi:hypothetical protein
VEFLYGASIFKVQSRLLLPGVGIQIHGRFHCLPNWLTQCAKLISPHATDPSPAFLIISRARPLQAARGAPAARLEIADPEEEYWSGADAEAAALRSALENYERPQTLTAGS